MRDFTIADVLNWARTKPADEGYDYFDAGNCAVAQFGRETGRDHLVDLSSTEIDKACPGLDDIIIEFGWTFGALVSRLEAAVQEEPTKRSDWLSPQTYLDSDCGRVDA